jgi:hypothetical protein
MHGALLYLLGRTTVNRFASQIKRVRQPRYALAILAVVAYFWFFLLSPARTSGDYSPFSNLHTPTARALVTAGILLLALSPWFVSRRMDALAFTQPEVHFLFPGPIDRRVLVAFKLLRMQIAIMISAIIWTLIVRGAPGLPSPFRGFGFWLVLATISLHQVGAALVHAAALREGAFARHGQRAITLALSSLSALFAWAGYTAWQATAANVALVDASFLERFAAMLQQPLLQALTFPFRIMGNLAFAGSVGEWLNALPFVAALFLAHVVLILRADFPFEESAAASARVAKRVAEIRQRGLRAAQPVSARAIRSTRLPLSPLGEPSMAIIWKNALAFLRSLKGTSRVLVFMIVMPMIVAFVIGAGTEAVRETVAILILVLLVWSVILGPRFIRNDLRADLAQLSLLRTFPLSGRRLVAAEVMSATLALTALQTVFVLAGFLLMMSEARAPGSFNDRLLISLALPFALFVLNTVNMLIQNGAALMFPAWMSPGMNRPTGVEAMGQNILIALGSLLVLLLVLLPAALTGALAWFVAEAVDLRVRILLTSVASFAALTGEMFVLIQLLGRLFERTEPSAL